MKFLPRTSSSTNVLNTKILILCGKYVSLTDFLLRITVRGTTLCGVSQLQKRTGHMLSISLSNPVL
jgi:hypothetical protein